MTTSPTAAATVVVAFASASSDFTIEADAADSTIYLYAPEEPDDLFADDVWCPPPQPTRPPLHRAPRATRQRMPRAPRLTSWLVEGRGR